MIHHENTERQDILKKLDETKTKLEEFVSSVDEDDDDEADDNLADKVVELCRNQDPMFTVWAVLGECDND